MNCNFEEVYQNGDTQQGLLWIKNENLRYQYNDNNLYTIILKDKRFFLIDHKYQNAQRLNDKTETFEIILQAFKDFPNVRDYYKNDQVKIKIEKSTNNFIKRISILSSQSNLSLNFFSCVEEIILDDYFDYLNFKKYKY